MKVPWVLGLAVYAIASCTGSSDGDAGDESGSSGAGGGIAGGGSGCNVELDANGCPLDYLSANGSCCVEPTRTCFKPDPSGCLRGYRTACYAGHWSYSVDECGRRCCTCIENPVPGCTPDSGGTAGAAGASQGGAPGASGTQQSGGAAGAGGAPVAGASSIGGASDGNGGVGGSSGNAGVGGA